MPGSIIAQIAIAPHKNKNSKLWSLLLTKGGITVMIQAATPERSIVSIAARFQRFISLTKKNTLAIISPKKNAHTIIGYCSNNHLMSLANDKILIPIPNNKDTKKLPLICRQKATIPSLNSILKAFKLIRLIESTNSSQMPDIKAIVPPDTPGTTSAAPIAIPFRLIIV